MDKVEKVYSQLPLTQSLALPIISPLRQHLPFPAENACEITWAGVNYKIINDIHGSSTALADLGV